MSEHRIRRLVGLRFMLGAILINGLSFILIATFDYLLLLRVSTGVILTRFAAGGSSLILTWLAFAWARLPLLFAIGILPHIAGATIPSLTLGVDDWALGQARLQRASADAGIKRRQASRNSTSYQMPPSFRETIPQSTWCGRDRAGTEPLMR